MSDNKNQSKPIANEHQTVQLQVGIEDVSNYDFEKRWNNGEVSVQMKPIKAVVGPCDETVLTNILLEKLNEHLKDVKDDGTNKFSLDVKFGRIAIAKSFDAGKQYAIGVLEYKVVTWER